MAIIDRVKERVETDLSDTELQLIIDEANQDIINRYGPHANPAAPITARYEGSTHYIILDRPIDTSQTIEITEYWYWPWNAGSITLSSDDYLVWQGGYKVERLPGTHAFAGSTWADYVQFQYVPVNDGDQREEIVIKLTILATQYDSNTQVTIGDVAATTTDYTKERSALLATLAPKHGLMLR